MKCLSYYWIIIIILSVDLLPQDSEWGYKYENSSWNGMTLKLIEGECDVICSALFMDNDRREVITFFQPINLVG